MTERQAKKIERNLRAFEANFGEVRIEKGASDKNYYVYYPASAKNHVWYGNSIEEINGWLYGCVQGVLVVAPYYRKEIKK